MLLSPFYDMIIRFCGHKIDQAIYQCKDQHRTGGTADEQSGICHAEQQEHPADQWKCHRIMKPEGRHRGLDGRQHMYLSLR